MLLNCGVKRRFLKVPWTARRSNQTILKEISPECSSEGLMLKLKFQHFGHLMWRADSFEKTLMLGKIKGRRRRGQQDEGEMVGWHHLLNGDEFGWTPGVDHGQGKPGMLQPMGSQRVGHDWATELMFIWVHLRTPYSAPLTCVSSFTNIIMIPIVYSNF